MNSTLFRIDLKDVSKGLVMAIITGLMLPVAAAFQTPGFDVFNANWAEILNLAINGSVIGFTGYLVKNFLSTSDGKVLGSIG